MAARRSARVAASEAMTAKPRPARNARISMTLNVPARTRTETAIAQNDSNAPVIQRTTATRFLAGTLVLLPSYGRSGSAGRGADEVQPVTPRRAGFRDALARTLPASRMRHRRRRPWETARAV